MEFEKSRIERLKRALYSRDPARIPQEKRTPVHGEELSVNRTWGERPNFEMSPEARMAQSKNNSFFNNFLGIAIIFFCLALGIAVFIFFGGLNMISSNNVDIKIVGPSSISSGEELDAGLSVVNQNHTDLINTTLYIDYPDGAQSVIASSTPVAHDKIDLGTVPAGGNKVYSLRTLFFGETGTVKTIKLTLEYTVKGSDAVFSKQKTYDISIGSSPIILNVAYPNQANSGQSITLSIDVTSNSPSVVPHSLIKIDYPYGFTYTTSNVKPVRPGVFDIGDLKNGDKKNVSVTGVLVGQNLEERSFTISVGTKSEDPSKDFDTPLAQSLATIALSKSFFDLSLTGNGSPIPAVNLGDHVPVSITFTNTLPDTIVGSHIEAVLSGNALDRASVVGSNGGFYRSLDNTILWDKTTTDTLTSLSSGSGGSVALSLASPRDPAFLQSIKNPHIDVSVTMSGNRTSGDTPDVSSTGLLTIRFKTILALSATSYHVSGPFANTGPVPPMADKETTYTVTWTLTNTSNDVSGTSISATLPPNVAWLGKTSPTNERVVYNPDTRAIVWNTGLVAAGTGFTYSARTVSFQVGLTPSITDRGTSPLLVTQTAVSGSDTYASSTISGSIQGVSIHSADPNFHSGDDIVK